MQRSGRARFEVVWQVHGIVHDTIDFVRGIITTEMNSATDNPIVLVTTAPDCPTAA